MGAELEAAFESEAACTLIMNLHLAADNTEVANSNKIAW